MKKYIDKEIVEWSMQTFPDLTIDKQRDKLNEELKEFSEAKTSEEHLIEAADVYIVCAILANRFDDEISKCLRVTFLSNIVSCYGEKFFEFVENKMKKNKARIWAKQEDGTYHHKEEE